ncbi:MAG: hypothetical protein M5R42_06375 [Rhodocyclaceae bacterium]|nr:hypothetical protein [Rhodocyclaceae bacterium]
MQQFHRLGQGVLILCPHQQAVMGGLEGDEFGTFENAHDLAGEADLERTRSQLRQPFDRKFGMGHFRSACP